MDLIFFLVVGLAVGGLARAILPGADPMGIPMTLAVGVGGSLIGGFVGLLLLGRPGGLILSVGAAVGIVYLLRKRRQGA